MGPSMDSAARLSLPQHQQAYIDPYDPDIDDLDPSLLLPTPLNSPPSSSWSFTNLFSPKSSSPTSSPSSSQSPPTSSHASRLPTEPPSSISSSSPTPLSITHKISSFLTLSDVPVLSTIFSDYDPLTSNTVRGDMEVEEDDMERGMRELFLPGSEPGGGRTRSPER